jgi:hypothetical protein
MNVGIGTEAAQFLFREHVNSIFGTVHISFPRLLLNLLFFSTFSSTLLFSPSPRSSSSLLLLSATSLGPKSQEFYSVVGVFGEPDSAKPAQRSSHTGLPGYKG